MGFIQPLRLLESVLKRIICWTRS